MFSFVAPSLPRVARQIFEQVNNYNFVLQDSFDFSAKVYVLYLIVKLLQRPRKKTKTKIFDFTKTKQNFLSQVQVIKN